MRVTKSTLSQSLKKVFGISPFDAKNRKTNRGRTRRLVLESLENRALFAADFGSAMSFGNDTGNSVAYSIAADSAGNSYMTGYFSGTVDFDQAATHSGDSDILTSRGPQDIFVVKYAPDDSLAWVQRMGGNSASTLSPGGTAIDTGRKITVDGGGHVCAVGSFAGSADFGST